MHIPGVIGSLKTSVVSAVSHVQLTFSVGDSDSPLCLQVLQPSATQSQGLVSQPAPQQGLQSNLPESEVISLCRPSLLSKLGTHFQLCSQGGSQQVQNLFCLDEVTKIEKSFVLEIFETISPNSSGALHDAHELNPKDFAKHVNNMCTGNNGPEPYITPVVPPKMSHDVPKVLGNFVEFQALYLWELGRMIEWYIQYAYCAPTRRVAFDFWVSVVDHQRAFAVHICRQHLLMCVQEAKDCIASLSRAQLVHLCTGVPDVRSGTTEMTQILEPLRYSPDTYFVLPGGPVQPLKSNLYSGHNPSQQQEIPVAVSSNLTGNIVVMQPTACTCDAAH